jgi:hypothetical protein
VFVFLGNLIQLIARMMFGVSHKKFTI